jgi:hypothetical protein
MLHRNINRKVTISPNPLAGGALPPLDCGCRIHLGSPTAPFKLRRITSRMP